MTTFESPVLPVAPGRPHGPGRQRLIEDHLPLVRSIARRFADRGERLEDLVQVGSIGLITAVDRCDPERSSKLTAYAASYVEGEIRRHLRDRCSVVRIPRRLRDDATLVAAARAPLPLDDGIELDMSAMGGDGQLDEEGVARAMIAAAARSLDSRERRLVALRYYGGLSQAEIGTTVGISQVHVSRLLQGAIAKMRARLGPDEETGRRAGAGCGP